MVDAFVLETNCGAPCSFGYEVEIAPKGSYRGQRVASLDGATRNQQAWGVNLRWSNPSELSVEYLRAEDSKLLMRTIFAAGRQITVSLHDGVQDPTAPGGGMLYNLKNGKH
jgi:hypothetical protein